MIISSMRSNPNRQLYQTQRMGRPLYSSHYINTVYFTGNTIDMHTLVQGARAAPVLHRELRQFTSSTIRDLCNNRYGHKVHVVATNSCFLLVNSAVSSLATHRTVLQRPIHSVVHCTYLCHGEIWHVLNRGSISFHDKTVDQPQRVQQNPPTSTHHITGITNTSVRYRNKLTVQKLQGMASKTLKSTKYWPIDSQSAIWLSVYSHEF